ncbi:MAG: menaquinone biosynthesis protein [Dehalococcoidia bacterium]
MTTNNAARQKLKVGHMTYLNSEVFYRKLPTESCELIAMHPRAMAVAVESGELAAGPLPIAEVFRLGDQVRSLGNLGVSSDGPALSVCLFSHKPIEMLSDKKIAVTTHTATSIQLLRVLFADLWDVSGHEFVDIADAHDAALWIGDPALERKASGQYPYQYDLGSAWKKLTGLPFVFAEWVIRTDTPRELAEIFEQVLIESTQAGIRSVGEISRARATQKMTESEVIKYVRNFAYFFGPDERAGQTEFKTRLGKLSVWRPASATGAGAIEMRAISTSY